MISRPFALIGFSFTLTFLALNLFDGAVPVVCFSAIACMIICFFARSMESRFKVVISMLCVVCACAVFSLNESYVYQPALQKAGSEKTVKAQIISLPEKSEKGWFYTVKSSEIDGEKAEYKISFFSRELLDAEPYDKIEFTAELYSIEESDSETVSYYKAKGIFLQSFWHSEAKVIHTQEKPLGYYFLMAKSYAVQRLNSLMSKETAGLAAGMLTGDKSGLDSETRNAFSRAGLSHIMAVSGLHMSIIVMGLYKLLMLFMRRFRWIPGLVCVAVSFAYAGVSGFSMSAIRSCVMIAVLLLGSAFYKRSDSLNSLGLAAFGITLANPYAVLDWSFMLSFSATLGIVLCSKHINSISGKAAAKSTFRPLRYVVRAVISAALISLAATVFCLPVTIFFVGSASLVFLPANLLTLYAVPVALVTAMMSLPPLGVLSRLTAAVCSAVCRYILRVTQCLSSFKYAAVSTDSAVLKISFVVTLAVIALERLVLRNKKAFVRACILTVVFAVMLNLALNVIL